MRRECPGIELNVARDYENRWKFLKLKTEEADELQLGDGLSFVRARTNEPKF